MTHSTWLGLVGLVVVWALNWVYVKWPRVQLFALIVACVIATLLFTLLLAKKPKLRNLSWPVVLGLLAALAFPGWSTFARRTTTTSDLTAIRVIVSSEELILALSPKLSEVNKSVSNLRVTTDHKFSDSPVVRDLVKEGDGVWGVGAAESRPANTEIWSSLLSDVSYFDHAKFKIVRGDFTDSSKQDFETLVSFSARARMKSGHWGGMHGTLSITWFKEQSSLRLSVHEDAQDSQNEIEPTRWRISRWETKTFEVDLTEELWFQESLTEVLPRPADLQNLRRSQHHEETIQYYKDGRTRIPHRYFTTISANQKPGIAVADIDDDGDDDIFVTVRRGYCKLLENQGDGTFIENAAEHGLNVKNHCTSALFADFDNDGDADLMLGRSLLPTIYFVNEGRGQFRPVKSTNLPRLAISMSAADYDKDGLLDVYVCTYRPAVLGGSSPSGGVTSDSKTWPDEFLAPDVAKVYYERHAKSQESDPLNAFPNLLNQLGPPNVLLRNLGNGQFAPVDLPPEFDVWKNSLQATWSDYDEDGDPDLYVANDWAPDHLFRNDGEAGFTDVTKQAGTTKFGFAMGASWGDYDNDGDHDLYVTNMFSKAGMRITAQVSGLDPDYQESAAGNYLYQQQPGGSFDLVSGLEPPKLLVAKAGWAWGGQFADFNNDGWLDIYSINGYFSAPKEVATQMDL